ncbi:ATP-binding protein [Thalassolituus marinus]|uniref:Sensor protein n=1 Tax=Thalassolituus marinus TaxID=671053 RepID=A0ABS7ZPW2_9GAMM|nr:ATP-binding protein [Thalassolituus marinus]MCA6063733.1 HAMP domain-containing protein [Thalassolituus marinus]
MNRYSVITKINLSLTAIIVMAVSTILVSYWLSDQADNDAYAINVAGSLRMQSYRYASSESVREDARSVVNSAWEDPVMRNVIREANLTELFELLQSRWINVQSSLKSAVLSDAEKLRLVDDFVIGLNTLVLGIQKNAEAKIRAIRTFQVIAFFITVILSVAAIYWVYLRLTLPLAELTNAARQVGRGDFTCNLANTEGQDELSLLSKSFNQMCRAIAYMYESLEKQVDEKTTELRNSNTTLTFLYKLAWQTSTHEIRKDDFSQIIYELSRVTGIADIELCLLTESGDIPYLQVNGTKDNDPDCASRNCRDCVAGNSSTDQQLRYAISRENTEYGVLVIHGNCNDDIQQWQDELLRSVATQFAIALSLQGEEEKIRRITLMNERNTIARELHDSLAQALSYLKIQVTRLNRALAKNDQAIMMDVSNELKNGLDSAYRQLRELLTTFRLKVDGKGLITALQKTVEQFQEQSSMEITLDYDILHAPLSPQEEIHLLQIIREACRNAINHSHGKRILIKLTATPDKKILLSIEDDGIGIDTNPEKLNHYGLAIIQERSHQLNGDVRIQGRADGGTGVYFEFMPEYSKARTA